MRTSFDRAVDVDRAIADLERALAAARPHSRLLPDNFRLLPRHEQVAILLDGVW